MPRCLEPGETFEICLDFDANKPHESRPVFLCKTMSVREAGRLSKALDGVFDAKAETFEQLHELLSAELVKVVTGWRNMGGREFSQEALLDLLTSNEVFELARKIIRGESVNVDEKKS